MDSKLQKIAIFISLAAILLVVVAVIFTNTDWLERVTGAGNIAGSVAESSQGAEGTDADGGAASGGLSQEELSAFEKDADFFDKEAAPSEDVGNRLSMMVTSVEKDLRIQIVDMDGRLVTGESFYVELESLGEYKDLDKDGIIYIGDLPAGEYSVKLQPMEGYIVPQNATKVRVKAKVEYVVIDDISLLILSEADIDAATEDTRVSEAVKDSDETEKPQMQKPSGGTKLGIDVSKWNGEIDWAKVKAAGVEFAIVRAGYRGSKTGALVEDPCFKANMKGAAENGIPVGVYFFTQAVNEVEAVEEASAVIELVREFELELPVFIDTEGAGGNGRADNLDVETRTLVCEAFCRTIDNAGYEAGVYASHWWYLNMVQVEKLEQYFIWLAEYKSETKYPRKYGMWQYTSKGRIDGLEGNVDLNHYY